MSGYPFRLPEPCLCGDRECRRCFPGMSSTSGAVDLNTYWVEVLMDDGSQVGFATEGYTEDDAEDQACMDAKERGLRPVEIVYVGWES